MSDEELHDEYDDHPLVLSLFSQYAMIGPCLDKPGVRLRYGKSCPFCGGGPVEYDSMLNLVCQSCKKTQSGAFT